MTIDDRSLERAARSWLEAGPTQAPGRAVDDALLRIQTVPQERDLRIPWRLPTMNPFVRVAGVAIVIAVAVGAAFLYFRPVAQVGPPQPTVEGTWEVSFSHAEMVAAGLVDADEDNAANFGHFYLTFRAGKTQAIQLNQPGDVSTGTYTVNGTTLSLAPSSEPGRFEMPFAVSATSLTFSQGPVAYRVKPWTRILGAGLPSPAPSPEASLASYRVARDSICVALRTPRSTLDARIGDGLYDPATPASVRAPKIAALRDLWFFGTIGTDLLDALPVPAELTSDEAQSIADSRQILAMIAQELPLLEAGKVSEAETIDVATNPIGANVEAFEQRHSLAACP